MWRDLITTVLEVAAATLLVTSAALIYAPAAFAVAGLALGFASWRATPSSKAEAPR